MVPGYTSRRLGKLDRKGKKVSRYNVTKPVSILDNWIPVSLGTLLERIEHTSVLSQMRDKEADLDIDFSSIIG